MTKWKEFKITEIDGYWVVKKEIGKVIAKYKVSKEIAGTLEELQACIQENAGLFVMEE